MSEPVPDLIIPVYLNQRLVFDLVAMLQDGITTVTRVSEARRETGTASGEVTGRFGLSEALSSLLRVNLSGKVSGQSDESLERTSAGERVHTPASLFFVLRNLLLGKGVLQVHSTQGQPKPGQFVEFVASLRRNPLIEAFDSLVRILELVVLFAEPFKPRHGAGKGGGQGQFDFKRLRDQVESLSTSLKAGGTQDLVADLQPGVGRALLTVEEQFLNDPSLSDLVDGTFRVLGKVSRSVENSTGSINLLRKTPMSRVPSSALEQMTSALATLQQEHGFTMPVMEVEIKGPVFQVLPLAIFT